MVLAQTKKLLDYLAERKQILIFAGCLLGVSYLPYLLGYWNQGEDWVFSGFVFGVQDGNSYIAKMLSGAWGDWLFRTPYTTHDQPGVVAFFPYLLLGKISSPPAQRIQLVSLYQLYRGLAGTLMTLAIYDFLDIFLTDKKWVWWGLVLSMLGGGFGWMMIVFGQKSFLGSLPLEFISPETFGFLSWFGLPHLALGRALLLWGFVVLLQGDRTNGILLGFLWLMLGLLQPMFVVLAWAVTASFHLYRWITLKNYQDQDQSDSGNLIKKSLKQTGIGLLISGPLIGYTAVKFITDPILRTWAAQNQINSPHPLHYLIAYGLTMPLAVLFIGQRKAGLREKLLAAWILIFPFLVYAPVSTQRRLAEGFWMVLIAVSLIVLERLPEKISSKLIYLGTLVLPSSLLIFSGSINVVSQPGYPLFRRKSEVKTFQYLAAEEFLHANVLASFESGNALPSWAPVNVVIGHGPESIRGEYLEEQIDQFFNESAGKQFRIQLVNDQNVDFIFYGPFERQLGTWDPGNEKWLVRVFELNEYSIYQVIK